MGGDILLAMVMLLPFLLFTLLLCPFKFRAAICSLHGFFLLPLALCLYYTFEDNGASLIIVVGVAIVLYIAGWVLAALVVRKDFAMRSYSPKLKILGWMLPFIMVVVLDLALVMQKIFIRMPESLQAAPVQNLLLQLQVLTIFSVCWLCAWVWLKRRPKLGLAALYGMLASVVYTHLAVMMLAQPFEYSATEKWMFAAGALLGIGPVPGYYYQVSDQPISWLWYAGMPLCFILCAFAGSRMLLEPPQKA